MWAERIAPIDELATARSLSAEPGFAWLDSHRSDARDGRYSFLAAWPEDEISVAFGAESPFSPLAEVGRPTETVNLEGPKPNQVPQWIGYIAYDAFWTAPVRGTARFERPQDPIVFFRYYPALLAIDHLDGSVWIVGDDEGVCRGFRKWLEHSQQPRTIRPAVGRLHVDDAAQHRSVIVKALDYIARGDVYEVNLARRWAAKFEGSASELWQAMREASRVPLGMFLDAGERAVLACTMERFVRWHAESRTLVTRPIKGT
ncbi:MAG: chorismate-binding protein, partial [Deltaproteobacteria bacterium]|nr:chorismate-binding protein [Deltaproteobacteria bacterium]